MGDTGFPLLLLLSAGDKESICFLAFLHQNIRLNKNTYSQVPRRPVSWTLTFPTALLQTVIMWPGSLLRGDAPHWLDFPTKALLLCRSCRLSPYLCTYVCLFFKIVAFFIPTQCNLLQLLDPFLKNFQLINFPHPVFLQWSVFAGCNWNAPYCLCWFPSLSGPFAILILSSHTLAVPSGWGSFASVLRILYILPSRSLIRHWTELAQDKSPRKKFVLCILPFWQ